MSSTLAASSRCFGVASGIRWRRLARVLTVFGLLAVGYGPLLSEFCQWQLRRPHYEQFFVVPLLGLGLFAWRFWGAPQREDTGVRWPCYALVGVSWLTLLVAHTVYSPLLAAVSAILLTGAGVYELTRRRTIPYAWGTWALLWLALPLPLGRDRLLMARLQEVSSHLSSCALDLMGVLHSMEGNILQLAAGRLFVDEACSGLISVLLVVNLALAYGVLWQRSAWHVACLGLAGVGWAVVFNVGRIVTIATALVWWEIDLSTGMAHEILGIVTMLFALLGVVATDPLITFLLAPIAPGWEEATGSEVRAGRWLVGAWDLVAGWGDPRTRGQRPAPSTSAAHQRSASRLGRHVLTMATSFALLAPWGLWLSASEPPELPRGGDRQCIDRALHLRPALMPQQLANANIRALRYVQRERRDQFGEHSAVYEYRHGSGMPLFISCDFPFRGGWHELSVCYQGSGWNLIDRQVRAAVDSQGRPWSYVTAQFRRPEGEHAAIVYCAFTATGQPVSPPEGSFVDAVARALSRRRRATEEMSFQVQVFAQSPAAFSDQRLQDLGQALVQSRDRFRQHVLGSPTSDPSAGE